MGEKAVTLASGKRRGALTEGQAEDSADDLHGEQEPSEPKPGVASIDLRPIAPSADRDERRKLDPQRLMGSDLMKPGYRGEING